MPNPPSPDTNEDDWEQRLFGGYKRQWWAGAEVYRMGSVLDEPAPEADPHAQVAMDAWREKVTDPQAIKAFEDEYLCTPHGDEEDRQRIKTELFRHAYGKSNISPEMYRLWKLDQIQDKAALLALLKSSDRYNFHVDVGRDNGTTPSDNVSIPSGSITGRISTKFTSATQGEANVVDGSNDVHVHARTHTGAAEHTFTVEIPGVPQQVIDDYRHTLDLLRGVHGDEDFHHLVTPLPLTEESMRAFTKNFHLHENSLYGCGDTLRTTDVLGMMAEETGTSFYSWYRYNMKDMGEQHSALGIQVPGDTYNNLVIRKAGGGYPFVRGHAWHIDHTTCGFSFISPGFPSYDRASKVAEQILTNCQWGLSGYEPGEVFNSLPKQMGEYMLYMTRRDVDFEDYQTWLLRSHR